MKHRKKLIEVALPLKAINEASAREKSIRHGHPSTLHLWWARRPLAAARAVIFAQMVDDPSTYTDVLLSDPPKRRAAERLLRERLARWEKKARSGEQAGAKPTLQEAAADSERARLFAIIEDLVKWENTTNEEVLERARAEIWQSWRRACADNADHPRAKELFDRHKLPAFHDPFAGGGSLPLEAQRLGLEAYASDLNPVAVLINKAMIEIPPKFAGKPPVNPEARQQPELIARQWRGAHGLAEDVRYYGKQMRDKAEKRIGHFFPRVRVTLETAQGRPDLRTLVGRELTVIAWIWARTVKSPNPAFSHVDVPLASTFMLSTKPGKEAYVEPIVNSEGYRLAVRRGQPPDPELARNGTKLARGANFRCLMSGTPITGDYIKAEGKAGRIGSRLMAIVAEADRNRIYLSPNPVHEGGDAQVQPEWRPAVRISGSTQYLGVKAYGMERFDQLFTTRQLLALETFSSLINDAWQCVGQDAVDAWGPEAVQEINNQGDPSLAYADAVATYLAFCLDKASLTNTTQATWQKNPDRLTQAFGRQAIPMVWDFAEANPLSAAGGGFGLTSHAVAKVLERLPESAAPGWSYQDDATLPERKLEGVVSTDPPYFDNVPYADLSDYFYVWLRQSLRGVFPDLLGTMAVPKSAELVAFAYRHHDKPSAESFFLEGMTRAMHCLVNEAHPALPVTIFYAFRQGETDDEEGTASTGWDTFLEAVTTAGFGVSGTWPIRTEYTGNLKTKRNALASSIVLVCRPRPADAPTATRREFLTALKTELPAALLHLQRGNIAPVDLAQAAIGPGMAVYTRYARVLDAEGKPVPVREALALINQVLDEVLAEQEGDFDADTRWALAWFEQSGFADGDFGVAETLSKAKNTSVAGMIEAGILASKAGKARLLRPAELPADWDPETDTRLTVWEMVHHLIRVLESVGERATAELVAKLGSKAESARELAYRLYNLCERKKRAPEALAYNALVQSWPEITRLTRDTSRTVPEQADLFGREEE